MLTRSPSELGDCSEVIFAKMDLSADSQSLQNRLQFLKSRSGYVSPSPPPLTSDPNIDTIDIAKINFGDDESWLCTLQKGHEEQIADLKEWLHKNEELNDNFLLSTEQTSSQIESQKSFDSRTFTRPKKRFTRPSIERFNEEMYGSGNEDNVSTVIKRKLSIRPLSESFVIQEKNETTNGVEFDLSLPSSSYYFEKMSAETGEADSFQNMSPPSLVNSMCSSTFANLMESSFIKNDPVLREIRDTDFTESVLLQDSEPPMFQSITESCSSINSDTAENFLKKVSFNGTFRKNSFRDSDRNISVKNRRSSISENAKTYENSKELSEDTQEIVKPNNTSIDVIEANKGPNHNLNGTYRRTPKKNNTFRRSKVENITINLDSSNLMPQEKSEFNSTQTLIEESSMNSFKTSKSGSDILIRDNTVEDLKKQLSNDIKINTDLNRLSYCIERDDLNPESTFIKDKTGSDTSANLKRSSLGCSSGSADSLDRMSSSISSSSRGSNKMLNMADVDAIVEMQERSLQQVMSTPKPNCGPKRMWENSFISPIVPTEQTSDSEVSSNDDYKSVRSTISKTSLDNYGPKSAKSLGYLAGPVDTKIKTNYRSSYTVASQKPLQVIPNNVRNSYSNLRSMHTNIPGSQTNLYKSSSAKIPSTTNLKTMAPRLKGSYTSLRPINANLPVAPPIIHNMNTTATLPKASHPNVTQNIETAPKVVEVLPMPREKVTIVGDHTFIKPQQPKSSGLPRPTGIPRPASKIPGPRSSSIRTNQSRPGIH